MEKQLFVTQSVTETKSTDVEGVGTLRWVGQNLYRWVKNGNDSNSMSQGEVVCYDIDNADADIFTVVDNQGSTGDELKLLAGVVASESISSDEFGWIQVLGVNTNCIFTNPDTTDRTFSAGYYVRPAVADANINLKDGTQEASQPAYAKHLQLLEDVELVTTESTTAAVLIQCL
jgi:hypothetical protein